MLFSHLPSCVLERMTDFQEGTQLHYLPMISNPPVWLSEGENDPMNYHIYQRCGKCWNRISPIEHDVKRIVFGQFCGYDPLTGTCNSHIYHFVFCSPCYISVKLREQYLAKQRSIYVSLFTSAFLVHGCMRVDRFLDISRNYIYYDYIEKQNNKRQKIK